MRDRSLLWIAVALAAMTFISTAQAQPPRGGEGYSGTSRGGEGYRGPSRGGEGYRGPSRGGEGYRGPPGGGEGYRGPPGGGGGGYRGPGGAGGPGSGSVEDQLRRYDYFFRMLDRNGNGQIDADEVEGRRREMVERLADRAGLEMKFPMSLSQLREGIRKQAANPTGSGDSSSGDDKSDAKKAANESDIPGFGEPADLPPVPGFGETEEEGSGKTSASSSRPTSRSGSSGAWKMKSSSSSSSASEKIRNYAKSLMNRHDKNRNGKLEKDKGEWEGMSGNPREADRNDDGVITLEELTHRLNEFSKRSSGGKRSGGGSSGWADYYFRSAIDRLPDGLPDWFREKDADMDGQVSMAEYGREWNATRIAAFMRWDLNHDGVVTPEECLAAEEDD